MPDEPAKNNALELSATQRRLITTALAGLSLFVIGALVFGLFRLLQVAVSSFSGVLWPLAVAGVLALLLKPVVLQLERRIRFSRTGSIITLYGLVILVLAVVLVGLVPLLVTQTLQFIQDLPGILDRLAQNTRESFPQLMEFLREKLGAERVDALSAQAEKAIEDLLEQSIPAVGRIGHMAVEVFALAAGLGIIPVYLFFFLQSDRDPTNDLETQLSFLPANWRDDISFLTRHFIASINNFFQGQIVIGLIMGGLMAIGFSVAGVNFGFPLGLAAGLLNIIPYFGTVMGLGTVLPIAYLQPDGGLTLVLVALGIFTAVQILESYVLTPRIMGNRTGLHPLAVIISIFFWGSALGGLLGMILAIPLTAFFVVAWRLVREKYLDRLMKES